MRFLTFIASTLLIVLINQHSTSAAPTKVKESETLTVEELATAVPLTTEMVEMSSSVASKKMCPKGMEMDHEDHCVSIAPMEITTLPMEITAAPLEITTAPMKIASTPMKIVTAPMKIATTPMEITTLPMEITAAPLEITTAPLEITTLPMESTTAPLKTTAAPLKTTSAPLKTTVKPLKTTATPLKTTIEPLEVSTSTLEPSTTTVDPNACPENYARFQGSCLLVRPKVSSRNGARMMPTKPQVASIAGEHVETFRVGVDNSCPPGTQYSEHGICEKRVLTSEGGSLIKPNAPCPNNGRRVQGRCVHSAPKTDFETTMANFEDSEITTSSMIIMEDSSPITSTVKLPKGKKLKN